MSNNCPKCGEQLVGDGYTSVYHCPNAELDFDYEPDAAPIYCSFEETVTPYIVQHHASTGEWDAFDGYGNLISTFGTKLAATLATQKWAEEDRRQREIEESKRND